MADLDVYTSIADAPLDTDPPPDEGDQPAADPAAGEETGQ